MEYAHVGCVMFELLWVDRDYSHPPGVIIQKAPAAADRATTVLERPP